MYVRENVSCIPVPDSDPSNSNGKCERLFLKITETDTILLALYIPPGLCKSEQEVIVMSTSDTLERILSQSSADTKLLIAGDLNDLPTEDIELQFTLRQVVKQPTRGDAILDKILLDVKLVDMYNTPIVGPNLATSDHRTVFLLPIKLKTNITRI